MKKIFLLISLLFSFIFVFNSFADDSKPRLLTPKERKQLCREIAKDVNMRLKAYSESRIGVKKGGVKCLGKNITIMQIIREDMNEELANNFFSEEVKKDFIIAGFKEFYFEDLDGNRWVVILE